MSNFLFRAVATLTYALLHVTQYQTVAAVAGWARSMAVVAGSLYGATLVGLTVPRNISACRRRVGRGLQHRGHTSLTSPLPGARLRHFHRRRAAVKGSAPGRPASPAHYLPGHRVVRGHSSSAATKINGQQSRVFF